MAGIYIHIPFCKTRCIYCGFYSTTGLEARQDYVEAVCKEMTLRAHEATVVHTIYLGGGTPSQLSVAQLKQIFSTVYNIYKVAEDAEITMECNPDDVSEEFAQAIRVLPINRISMGVQTFDEQLLRFIRRRHTATQVDAAVQSLREAGIKNISIDLIYGIPGQSTDMWRQDVQRAISLNPEHISAYSLMFEEDTPLYRRLQQGLVKETDEETSLEMYNILIDKLESAGYEHYEISNFARRGHRSRHNSSYWTGIPYLGIGAAAHSFTGNSRQWNVSNIQQYINSIRRGYIPMEQELIDQHTRYNDTVTVALRTREGMNLARLPQELRTYCLENAESFIRSGQLELVHDHLRLTRKGIFVSDLIMSELMSVD